MNAPAAQSAQPVDLAATPHLPFPLSPGQSALWTAQQLAPEVALTVSQYVEIRGDLDLDTLGAAVRRCAVEMQSLQLRIVESDAGPLQVVDPGMRIDMELDDLRERTADEAEARAAAMEWMRAASLLPVRLGRDPLVRIVVLRLADEVYFWYARMHHIAIDGYGATVMMARTVELYNAAVAAVEPADSAAADLRTIHEADLAYRRSEQFDVDRAFWQGRVAEFPAPFSLSHRAAPACADRLITGAVLDAGANARFEAARKVHEVSRPALFVAALAGYLAAVTDSPDVVFSLPVTARTSQLLRTSAGFVSNVVPLHIPVRAGVGVRELAEQVRARMSDALEHQRYRHEDIRRDSGEGAGRRGFFGPMVNLMLFHTEIRLGTAVGELHVLATGPVEDLSVNVYNGAGTALHVDFEANPDRYTDDEINAHHSRFLRYFERFLDAAPDAAVDGIPLLDEAEYQRVVRDSNATGAAVPVTTLADAFAAQAARTPAAEAVRFGAETLSYAELDDRAGRLAGVLAARGVGPESVVGLAIPRSLELLIGMYAIVKAGGAYLPIDLDHPAERIKYILAVADPVCVLTVANRPAALPDSVATLELDTLDLTDRAGGRFDDGDRRAPLRPEHPAYVIFTSGSTGKPKGVAVSHAAIDNRLRWMQHEYPLDASDVVVQKTPASFDVSVWEFFWPLQVGAKLVVADPGGHRDPAYLATLMSEAGVTTAHFVPSMLAVFLAELQTGGVQHCRALRRVFCSGEALAAETVRTFAELSTAQLHNLYGPTEAAVDVTSWQCLPRPSGAAAAAAASIPIGAPVWNTQVYVLDGRLRPAPVGAVGELYLAGVQLARGYLGRGELTAQRFVANPYGGGRMYRTGDLVRWRPDGNLEYLGRTDFQVKIRGLRIEFGEIEAALLAEPTVAQAICVARTAAHGGHQLVAYVVAEAAGAVDTAALREALARALPDYMIPQATVVLDALPLGPNGKVDRSALPEPATDEDRPRREPRTDAERTLAALFAELLGRPGRSIGIDDSFFELGGDSLVAARVVARVGAVTGTRIALRDLFEAPTIAGLADRLAERAATPAARDTDDGARLRARPRPERIPLSQAQRRMWLLNRFDRRSAMYNMPLSIRLTGAVDVDALRAALTDVLARHESLRTTFPDDGAGPRQVIGTVADAAAQVAAQVVDTATPVSELPARLAEFARRGFDLATELPIRFAFYRSDADAGAPEPGATLAVVLHHIACDGASFPPLARDLATALAARCSGHVPEFAPLPVQYADYALWQRERLGADDDPDSPLARQVGYWRTVLDGLPDQLDLPTDRPRPRVPSHRGGIEVCTVDTFTRRRLMDLAGGRGATLFMALHGALAVLLARIGTTTDIAVGSPIAGRGGVDEGELDDLVGMFVNTLVLRTEVDLGAGFDALLDRVRGVDLGAFAHADVPFERLVEELNPERSPARHPLFQVMLSYQRDGAFAEAALPLPDGSAGVIAPIDTGLTKYDLQVTVTDAADGLRVEFGYAADLFDAATVAALTRRFAAVLQAVARDPQRPVGDLELLDDREAALLCPIVRAEAEPVRMLPELLCAAVDRAPDAAAVRFRGDETSYRELDTRANRLARMLIADGVGPEAVVAVAAPRSTDAVTAIWAVAKTGAAYLPIDPKYPAARVAAMVADAGVRVGITTAEHRGALPDRVDVDAVNWLALDSAEVTARCGLLSAEPVGDADRLGRIHPDHPSYLIYTSGSTGRPKAVVVTHRGLASFAAELVDRFAITAETRALHFASPSFDASVFELLPAFAAGATVVVAPEEVYGGADLAALLSTERVQYAFVTPAALATVDPAGLTELGVVAVGGDECGPELVAAWATGGATARKMYNAYGPSEATVAATLSAPMRPGEPVRIGSAVRGMRLLVLDQRLHPVPAGVPGELYLAGPGLARGYHGRPELSAGRFVANPFTDSGARMYRTGDLVCLDRASLAGVADAPLRFLGRADDQVKVRGYRIELREIDAVLLTHPGVGFARTVVHTDAEGRARLVSYVTADVPVTQAEVLATARAALPSYMVPATVTVLDRLPLTPAGKLDRRALPAPEFAPAGQQSRPPATDAERRVAAVFCAVLGLDAVGAEDGFFDLGGTSLLATRLVTGIRAEFGVELEVRRVFEAPTVAALVELIAGGAASARTELVARPRQARIPLSFAQQRIWLLNQDDPEAGAYNIAFAVRLLGVVDVIALRTALTDVVARHEVLRTVFPADEDGPTQVVTVAAAPEIPEADVPPDEVSRRVRALAGRGFDLAADTPLRAELLRVSDTEHVLAVVIHHIAADGWSIAPLTADFLGAYQARRAGSAPDWAPLPVQYADYSLWQRDALGDDASPGTPMAEQLAYWTRQLADLPAELPLPYDRPRPAQPTFAGAAVGVPVPAEVTARLRALAREHDGSLFMVLHTAFAVALRLACGSRDVVIGAPVADRRDAALDDLVGMFVNTVVLRTEVSLHRPFRELLRTQIADMLAALANSEVPFERVVEVLNPERVAARHPLFQVALTLQEQAPRALVLPEVELRVEDHGFERAKFDLELRVTESAGAGASFELGFSTDLFDEVTVAALGERLQAVLAAVAADPDAAVGDIDVLTRAERAAIAPARGARGAPPLTLPEYFGLVAARHKDRIAVRMPRRRDAAADAVDAAARASGPEKAACVTAQGPGSAAIDAAARASGPEKAACVTAQGPGSAAIDAAVRASGPEKAACVTAQGPASAAIDVSYSALDAASNRMARALIQLGVGPEDRIALGVTRSVESVLGALAVSKTGAAWVPVDPRYPAERITHMVSDSRVRLGLTVSEHRDELPADVEWMSFADVMRIKTGVPDTEPVTDAERIAPLRVDNLAYVIYTSGSTGVPKGCAMTHRGLSNYANEQRHRFGVTVNSKALHFASPSFDASLLEVLLGFCAGATVVLAPTDVYGGDELGELYDTEEITHTFITPAALATIDPVRWPLPKMRSLVVGGEAYGAELVQRWVSATAAARTSGTEKDAGATAPGPGNAAAVNRNRKMFNVYGPTETTIVATISEPMGLAGPVDIGRPVRGVFAVVLDERMRPCAPGVPGDLYLGGNGLARGYLGRPGLSAARFIAAPIGPVGTRIYRTGDVVRWTAAGELSFVGRSDDQVKIRGFRIELGEITAVVGAHPAVRFAHTEVRRDESGEARIVAFALADSAATDELVESIRTHAASRLPGHMVPAAVMLLDGMPLSATGKLDRRALPEPVFRAARAAGRTVQTAGERLVAEIMAEVIGGGAEISAEDSFFDNGGNSLSATKLVARIASATGVRLAVRTVFEQPTPAGLAALVAAADPQQPAGPRLLPALGRRERPARVPLSPAQQRLWFLNRYDSAAAGPASGVYNIPVALRMRGELDLRALRLALRDIRSRHESLRTIFPDSPDGPYQSVLGVDAVAAVMPTMTVAEDELPDAVRDLARRDFDLATETALRATLVRVDGGLAGDVDADAGDDHLLVLVLHHIAMDGASVGPLAADLMTAYRCRLAGQQPDWADLPVQYADFALWQREVLGDENDPDSVAAAQLAYWQRTLADLPDRIELPSDRPRPPLPSYRGSEVRMQVEAGVHAGLVELGRRHEASLFMVLHTALAVLLHRMAAVDDVCVGTPIAGRAATDLDELVGMFVGTLALRTRVDGGVSFARLLGRVREDDLDAFAHADVPFERLVEVLNPTRSSAHHPLFQVVLSVHNAGGLRVDLPGLEVVTHEIDPGIAKFDLQFTLVEDADRHGAGGLDFRLNYAADLFDADTATRIARRFVRVLSAAASDPEAAVGDLQVLDQGELAALSPVHGQDTGAAITFPEVFTTAASFAPHTVAVRAASGPDASPVELTYGQVDRVTNRIARVLIAAGIGPERFVALGLPRSVESVVAMIAVAKTGAAFVPIDPNYPAERKQHMLTDAGPTMGLTLRAHQADLPDGAITWRALDDEAFSAEVARASSAPVTDGDRIGPLRLEHAAYVIYTSGSTGMPKGVTVSHAGISNFAYETAERFDVGPDARVLHFATPSFDAAMLDLLFALGGSATLVIAPAGVYGGAELTRVLARERITHTFVTTAALATAEPPAAGLPRHVLFGGEACPPDLVERWAEPGEAGGAARKMYNVYGPTETTIVTTMGLPMAVGAPITIGGPIRGVSAVVLDARLNPVPVGVTGELYLAGPGLARGYHRRPGLTAGRFVADPYGKPGERMYRTGDLVRWSARSAERELEHVGRADHQVKIRGFRIEPGEIDAVLARHAAVEFSLTLGHPLPSGATALVSYVKPVAGASATVAELRDHVAASVPNYMVPQAFTVLDALPLNAVGKLDRAALPAPVFGLGERRRAPQTVVEFALCEAFETVLGLDSVGVDESFFDLGGNSLLATRVAAVLREQAGMELPVQLLFVDPTPAGIAHSLETSDTAGQFAVEAALNTVLPLRTRGVERPLFCIHPAVGLAWCYSGLPAHLDQRRPVYGLQSVRLAGGAHGPESIAELAEHYLAEIRRIQPSGPYHLLGWSLGGLIAHELAVRLSAAGADVALLAMLDSYVLTDSDVAALSTDVGDLLREFLPAGAVGADAAPTLAEAAEVLRSQGGPFAALTDAQLERLYAGYRRGTELATRFTPGRFEGNVLFVTAAADEYNRSRPDRTALSWRPYVTGEIHEHAVDYRHSELTTPAALGDIGPLVRRYLATPAQLALPQNIWFHHSRAQSRRGRSNRVSSSPTVSAPAAAAAAAAARYSVLVNVDGQYSLWPDYAKVPEGWRVVFGPEDAQRCFRYIEARWTQLSPTLPNGAWS
ncbi:MAG: amino acid adenylation domain-containing protein [Mycobacteriaceae bacterium]|nr:amino acid adenylation domain-containing protein [Mycobacteriaceae bacterium]